MPYANNKGADQTAHPRSLISAFVVRYKDSIISLVSIFIISLLSLSAVAEQASLSLTWSQNPKTVHAIMQVVLLMLYKRLLEAFSVPQLIFVLNIQDPCYSY